MKRKASALILIFALLVSAVSGTFFVTSVRANGYIPTADTKIVIGNPQNKTYTNNTITLSFIVEEAFAWFNFFYSLDGQEMKAIEDMTMISEADLNAGKNPSVYVKTLRGSCVLSNLSEGRHHVAVYQVGDYPAANSQKGEIIRSATTDFIIAKEPELLQPEPFPTTLVIASVITVTVVGIGLLINLKKSKR